MFNTKQFHHNCECFCLAFCVSVDFSIQFPSYLSSCALTAAHTTLSQGHNRLFRSPKSLHLPTKPGTKSFVTLSTNTNVHHNHRQGATGETTFFILLCLEIKITFKLVLKVAQSLPGHWSRVDPSAVKWSLRHLLCFTLFHSVTLNTVSISPSF